MAEGHLTSAFKKDCCVLCKLGFENAEPVHVTRKGILTLINYSEKRGRDELHTYLNQCISGDPIEAVLVHPNCRRDFTDKKRIQLHSDVEDLEIPGAKRLRSSSLPFNWKEDCMLCGKPAIFDTRHPERQRVYKVSTIPMRCNLLECCQERGDLWASEVEKRLQGCIDLVAAEAGYHHSCWTNFMLKRDHNKKKTTGQKIAAWSLVAKCHIEHLQVDMKMRECCNGSKFLFNG